MRLRLCALIEQFALLVRSNGDSSGLKVCINGHTIIGDAQIIVSCRAPSG